MKRIFTTLLFLIITSLLLNAQTVDDLGCDGVRYVQDVFTDVKKTTVTYGENLNAFGANIVLQMDVYEPEGDDAVARPAIIFAFGGSFIFGQREDMAQQCMNFARKGYVAATIDYRLYPVFILGFPDSLDILDEVAKAVADMKASVRHLRMDAATDNIFKVHPDYIFVSGYSAGSVTALHTAYLSEDDSIPDYVMDVLDNNGGFDGDTGDAANKSYSSEVAGVLNLSGSLHRKEWLQTGEVPLASFHGTADAIVPFGFGQANDLLYTDGSGNLHLQAEVQSVDNYLLAVDGGGHTDIHNDALYQAERDEFYEIALIFFHSIFCSGVVVTGDQLNISTQVKAAPNPSNYSIGFDFGEINSTYELRVFDQLGRQVASFKNQNDANFILEKQATGIGLFFVNVVFENPNIAPLTKRIIFE